MSIEIEKKFLLTNEEELRLLEGATFLRTKDLTDAYYDDENYSVTAADRWLRRRGDRFELKMPLGGGSGSYESTNRYHELETEPEIREALGLSEVHTLEKDLELAGYSVFCLCRSIRQSYEKEGFTIDIDTVTYKDSPFVYAVAEVELLIESESEADAATAKIMAFGEHHQLTTNRAVLGKVAAFLQHERPEHYQVLQKAKVLK